jgi:hypothetical protein
MKYNTDGSGQSRVFYRNGKNYKRDKTFKSEEDAEAYVQRLKEERGSKRFEPIIERMRWNMSNQGGLLSRLGFTRYRVYVPIQEK